MNCVEFESLKKEFAHGQLSAQLHERCEQHLTSCSGCLEAWVGVSEEDFVRTQTLQSLLGTDASVCEFANTQLSELWDDTPSASARLLLDEHVNECDECMDLSRLMNQLRVDLPHLAEAQPSLDFSSRVWASVEQKQKQIPSRVGALLSKWAQRPRFTLEVSYAGTLLWLVLFGVPVNSAGLDQVSSSFERISEVLVETSTRQSKRLSQVYDQLNTEIRLRSK